MIKIVSVHLKTLPTQQVKVQIDGSETHNIQPQNSAAYIGLDNGETREFCLEGKSNPIIKYILTISIFCCTMIIAFIFLMSSPCSQYKQSINCRPISHEGSL